MPGATHDIRIDPGRGVVVKRFRSWDRDEPAREWRALRLLDEYAPGLAPRPLSASLNELPPVIRMSQVRQALAAGYELGADVRVRRAAAHASAWLAGGAVDRELATRGRVVLGHGDPNLANFLWDGREMHLVDFEDSGPSDRSFELAILVEHVSAWSDAGLDAATLLGWFELTTREQARLLQFRRLAALFWLMLLRPGGPGSRRNPPGTLRRQADRLLELLDGTAT
jgi:hypothetical protein